MSVENYIPGQVLEAQQLNQSFANNLAKNGDQPIGTLAWDLTFVNHGTVITSGGVGFAHTVYVDDVHMNNAAAQGGAYVGADGVDSAVGVNYVVNGAPANGVWAATDEIRLAGAGDGASSGNGHVCRYFTAYRTNLPITHTVVTSATPGSPVTSVQVASVANLGWGYPSGGGGIAVSSTYPQSFVGQSGTVYNVVGVSGATGYDAQGGPVGTAILLLSGPMSVADAANGAAITNAIPSATIGATFTAAISGMTLTVSGISGTLKIGDYVLNAALGTYVTALGTGTGGNGTYTVSVSQTLATTGSGVLITRVRGAALIGLVVETRSKDGYESGIGGPQENVELDCSAMGPDPIGQRKATLQYFSCESALLMLKTAVSAGATTLVLAQPTWDGTGYYPQISVPRPGFYVLGPAFATGCTVLTVESLGLYSTSGAPVLGDVYTYDTYQITISSETTASINALDFNDDCSLAPYLTVEFAQADQVFILPNVTMDIQQQIVGGGTIATSGVDYTGVTLGPNAAALRVGRNHQVALSIGENFDAGRSQVTQGASGTPQANFFRIIQQNRESTLVPGYMAPQGTVFTTSGTITPVDVGYQVTLEGTLTTSVALPLTTAVPADSVLVTKNLTPLLQRIVTQGTEDIGLIATGLSNVLTQTYDLFPGDVVVWQVGVVGGIWAPERSNLYGENGPYLTVAQLEAMVSAGVQPSSYGRGAVAANGLDVGDATGHGTGVKVLLKQGAAGTNFYTAANAVVGS